LQIQAGPFGLEPGNSGLQVLFEMRGGGGGAVLDVKSGFVVLLRALLDEELASGAANQRVMGVARARRGFESPQGGHLGVDAAQRVSDLAVGEDVESAVRADVLFEVIRVMVQAGGALELRRGE